MEHLSVTNLSIILVFLIFLSGFFSGSETGMMSLNRYRLRHLARKKHRSAKKVSQLLERPDRLLGVILIGNTFANIFASAIATIIAVRLVGEGGIALAMVILTFIVLIFSEVAPKTVAAVHPQAVSFIVVWPLSFLLKILYPFVWFVNTIVNGLLLIFRVKVGKAKLEHLTGEELRTVVHEAGSKLPSKHKEMLLGILDLEKVTVDHIMIPRNEVVGIDLEDEWSDVVDMIQSSRHTRLPVCRESLDDVVGFIHLRSVLSLLADEELNKETLENATEDAYFVPEGTPLTTQLLNFQQEKQRSALVVDEYGDIQGLITLEDILEEIVGEFTTDLETTAQDIYPQPDGSFLIDGTATIRDINKALEWKLPEEGPKTLSGLITEYLEYIPNPGTCMLIAGYPIEVIHIKDNMVKTAKVLKKLA